MKKLLSIVLMLLLAFTLVACATEQPVEDQGTSEEAVVSEDADAVTDTDEGETTDFETPYPIVVTDGFDRDVEIEKKPEVVVSLAPSMTETMYALGLETSLAARTDYDDYPADVLDIPSIGSMTEPNIEAIVEINPDVIFATNMVSAESLKKLEELGYPVLVMSGEDNLEGVYDILTKVGVIFNETDKSEAIVEGMKSDVAYVTEALEGVEKKSVYYVVGYGEYGDYTAGGDTFIGQLIEMAGGENIAADVSGWSYSLEKIVEADPEIIIVSQHYDTKAGFVATPNYQDLTAVKEGNVYEIDNNKLDRQGPRLAEGLVDLAKIIHPEIFE